MRNVQQDKKLISLIKEYLKKVMTPIQEESLTLKLSSWQQEPSWTPQNQFNDFMEVDNNKVRAEYLELFLS